MREYSRNIKSCDNTRKLWTIFFQPKIQKIEYKVTIKMFLYPIAIIYAVLTTVYQAFIEANIIIKQTEDK